MGLACCKPGRLKKEHLQALWLHLSGDEYRVGRMPGSTKKVLAGGLDERLQNKTIPNRTSEGCQADINNTAELKVYFGSVTR
ncbi:unnamed protein product [Boreogadus saida]